GGEGGKFGQQFARVFLPQLYGERLKIPPSFNQYLQDQPTGVVSLKGQSGNTWLAELASDNEGLFFVKGWKEFVRDHSIEMGHFLTFRYDGRSKFSVVIFDGMCIEKPSAFHAKPCKNLVVKIESGKGDMDINAADPSQASAAPLEESNGTTRKRVTEMDADGSTSKNRSSILENGMPEASAVTCNVAPTSLNVDMNAADPPEAVVVPLEESNQTTRKRIREIDANDSALQKSLRVREIDANGSALQKSLRVREIDANDSALQKSSRVREIDANDSALQSSRVREKSMQMRLHCTSPRGLEKLMQMTLHCTSPRGLEKSMQMTLHCTSPRGLEKSMQMTRHCRSPRGLEKSMQMTLRCRSPQGLEKSMQMTLHCRSPLLPQTRIRKGVLQLQSVLTSQLQQVLTVLKILIPQAAC
uniref:TF-B3 domain-containing protein n=3 Tax=Aegilops tauschii subsp. strangulata TaxID=200361 RepID=A0A453HK10_AEGTS